MSDIPQDRVRVLVVDDETALLDSYRQILTPDAPTERTAELAARRAALFCTGPAASARRDLDVDLRCAGQAPEAVAAVREALCEGCPYAIVFTDMRMPPGPDGLWTAREIRALDPDVDIVVVTAYSDVDPAAFVEHAPPMDKLFYLQKPFHAHEIRQLANALGTKWQAQRALGLMDALREAKEAAEAASLAKARFLSNITHEMRTPLNGVLGMTELLLETGLDARQRSYAEAVRQAGGSLLRLVDEVLDLSRIDAGGLELKDGAFDVRRLTEDVGAQYALAAARKGLVLRCEVAPGTVAAVRGDALRLRQILGSLLDNAVRFTERGQIQLRISAEPGADGLLDAHFDIDDTGPGIDPAFHARVFEPFFQIDDSAARRHGGAGLGLALAQRLARLMGGDVALASAPGAGTKAHLHVRLHPAVVGG